MNSLASGARDAQGDLDTVRESLQPGVVAHASDIQGASCSLARTPWEGVFSGLAASTFLLAPGTIFAGRYRLFERIARGGMGSVWSAIDENLQREVAIKFMSPELADNDEYRARFVQEARAAARIASPHVVTVFDSGVADGVPYMVLERLEGEDLHARLKRAARLSPEACARILNHVARGLTAAHAAGVVHRDIKPPNLFITSETDGDGETVKILDFGVAKHAGTEGLRTQTGVLLGSPHYMSPEQVRGVDGIDHASDLFSLGSVLYRCITGRLPFDGESAEVMVQIRKAAFTPPSSLVPHLPSGFDAFFGRALAKDARDRFPSASLMAAAFQRLVDDHAADRIAPGKRSGVTSLRLEGRTSGPPAPRRAGPAPRPSAIESAPRRSGPTDDASRRRSTPAGIDAVLPPGDVARGTAPVQRALAGVDVTNAPTQREGSGPRPRTRAQREHPRRVGRRGLGALVGMVLVAVGVVTFFVFALGS